MGLYLIVAFIISLSLVLYIVQSPSIKKQFQDFLLNLLKTNQNARSPGDSGNNAKIIIAKDLDATLENFFNRLLNQFITSWYSNISDDKSFLCNIKFDIAHAVRNLSLRCKDVSAIDIKNCIKTLSNIVLSAYLTYYSNSSFLTVFKNSNFNSFQNF